MLLDCRGLESALEAVRVSVEAMRVSVEAVRVSIETLRCFRGRERLEQIKTFLFCSKNFKLNGKVLL